MILLNIYSYTRPDRPDPQLNLVSALRSHDTYVYLTKAEATGLTLLMILFGFAFFIGIAVVPRRPVLQCQEIQRRSAPEKAEVGNAKPPLIAVFLTTVILFSALIFFLGNRIVTFVVSQGIVLSAW
jgi:hypothetical protein